MYTPFSELSLLNLTADEPAKVEKAALALSNIRPQPSYPDETTVQRLRELTPNELDQALDAAGQRGDLGTLVAIAEVAFQSRVPGLDEGTVRLLTEIGLSGLAGALNHAPTQ